MTDIVERFLEDLSYHALTCELEVCYMDKLCKIKRMEYMPDSDGVLVFRKEDRWSNDGYTVVEATELLNKYQDTISDILFEAYDGSLCKFVNLYEVQQDMAGTEFHLRILVGEDGQMSLPDNAILNGDIPITQI